MAANCWTLDACSVAPCAWDWALMAICSAPELTWSADDAMDFSASDTRPLVLRSPSLMEENSPA